MDEIVFEDLRLASDEALLRIGRNLLIYQRIETNLKWLEASGRPIVIRKTTTVASLTEQIHANHDAVRSSTLGTALKRAIRIGESKAKADEDSAQEDNMTFSAAVVLEPGEDSHKWLDGLYDTVVDARNRLAHGFLDAFDLETIESCAATCVRLDEEHDTALSFLHFTRSAIARRKQGVSMTMEFVGSEAFAQHLDHMETLASFARGLEQEARRLGRADGWCVFASAVHAVRASQPDLVSELLLPGHYKNIREAANASQIFQWQEEPAKKGIRLLFRGRTD